MIYILGVLTGLILALIWIVVSVKMPVEPRKIAEMIYPSSKPKGMIIAPTTDEEMSIQEKLDKAREDGIDIRLEDL